MNPPDPSEAAAEFAEEFLARLRRGERPTVAEYLRKRPDLTDRLEDVLPALLLLEATSAPAPPTDRPPRSAGPYDLVREIGRGGMGVVFEARHRELGRRAAVKMMAGAAFASSGALERFRREAHVTARLAHPGICVVYEAGVDDGAPFIAMRYVEGETLARRIARRRDATSRAAADAVTLPEDAGSAPAATYVPQPVVPADAAERRALVRIVEKAARALHAAHEAGVVHRDVKPANVMVGPDDEPVVLDFGLATDAAADRPSLTVTGDVVGTPAYLAPEQIRGRAADRRTDVWALGVALYEALSGVRPFAGPTRAALYAAILGSAPPSLDRLGVGVGRDLAFVAATATAKDPAHRYATAADFADDLARAAAGEPIVARPTPVWARAWSFARRRPATALAAALVVLLLAGAAGFAGFYAATRDDVALARRAAARDRVEAALTAGYESLGLAEGLRAADAFAEAGRLLASDPDAAAAGAAEGLADEVRAATALALYEADRVDAALAALDADPGLPARSAAAALLRAYLRRARDAAASRPADAAEPVVGAPTTAFDYFLRGLTRTSRALRGVREDARPGIDDLSDAIATSATPRIGHHLWRVRAAGATGDAALLARTEAPLVARWPQARATWFAIGLARESAGAFADAAEAFRRALALTDRARDGLDGEIAARLADALRKGGDVPGARAAAEDAVRRAPELALARLSLGLAAFAADDVDGAERAYADALRLDPQLSRVRENAAVLAVKTGRRGVAAERLRELTAREPGNAAARYLQGVLAFEDAAAKGGGPDAYAEAIARFEEAVARAPGDGVKLLALAKALSAADRDAEAADVARRAAAALPEDAEAAHVAGTLAATAGRDDEARAALERALVLDPERPESRCLLASLLLARGDCAAAVDALTRGLASPRAAGLAAPLRCRAEAWLAEAREGVAALASIPALFAAPAPDEDALAAAAAWARRARRFDDAARLSERLLAVAGTDDDAPSAARRAAALDAFAAGGAWLPRALRRADAELAAWRAAVRGGDADAADARAALLPLVRAAVAAGEAGPADDAAARRAFVAAAGSLIGAP
jgi:serine/threonine protein kinase/Tfp pilus assembly protein PilF